MKKGEKGALGRWGGEWKPVLKDLEKRGKYEIPAELKEVQDAWGEEGEWEGAEVRQEVRATPRGLWAISKPCSILKVMAKVEVEETLNRGM